ncbi:MAG: hypothetical protein U0T74_08120 [Chitinophagales bacterium]
MIKKLPLVCLNLLLALAAFCGGFEIKTSTIMDQPDVTVLGHYKGSWYAIGFELPGNLNKPPRYKIYKYAAGFGSGKTSVLYPSFGEKTYYIRAGFVGGKLSLFYARCEKRTDEESMLDNRDGHQVMPMIYRQDYDLNTLEPAGEAQLIFDEKESYFSSSGIEIAESPDRSKTAVLIKPWYKLLKYKVVITDNNTGVSSEKTFDFKLLKEYLKFLQLSVNNNGQVFLAARVRDDVISLAPTRKDKPQNIYYLFSFNKESTEPVQTEIHSPVTKGKYLSDPLMTILNNGEMLLSNDYYADEKRQNFQGVSLTRYNEALSATAKRDVTPDAKFLPDVTAYRPVKKGQEFAHLQTVKLLPLEGANFMLLTEYRDTAVNNQKGLPCVKERGYLLTCRIDESLSAKAQHVIYKKQLSSTVDYAFSAQAGRRGNEVYLFYNADWEEDGEHSMNLMLTRLPADGGAAATTKIVNTSGDFFTGMQAIYPGAANKFMFSEMKLVDYGDVAREVKLLEITVK